MNLTICHILLDNSWLTLVKIWWRVQKKRNGSYMQKLRQFGTKEATLVSSIQWQINLKRRTCSEEGTLPPLLWCAYLCNNHIFTGSCSSSRKKNTQWTCRIFPPFVHSTIYVFCKPTTKKTSFHLSLYRDHICVLTFIASQNKAFNVCRKKAARPTTTCGNGLGWWNDHENIVMSSNHPHYTHSASFLDITARKMKNNYN